MVYRLLVQKTQGKSMQGMWEYVLVERMEKPSQTTGGLFLPSNEKDPYYIVRIVSLGTGVVGESGVTAVTQVRHTTPGRGEWGEMRGSVV
jgi:co-chaperonin GroES (HSP10)